MSKVALFVAIIAITAYSTTAQSDDAIDNRVDTINGGYVQVHQPIPHPQQPHGELSVEGQTGHPHGLPQPPQHRLQLPGGQREFHPPQLPHLQGPPQGPCPCEHPSQPERQPPQPTYPTQQKPPSVQDPQVSVGANVPAEAQPEIAVQGGADVEGYSR